MTRSSKPRWRHSRSPDHGRSDGSAGACPANSSRPPGGRPLPSSPPTSSPSATATCKSSCSRGRCGIRATWTRPTSKNTAVAAAVAAVEGKRDPGPRKARGLLQRPGRRARPLLSGRCVRPRPEPDRGHDARASRCEPSCRATTPTNVLLSADLLAEMAAKEPATLAALKAGLAAGRVGLIGGEATESRLPLLSHESILAELQRGLAVYEKHLGRRPEVFGRWRYGLTPHLPGILHKLGFRRRAARRLRRRQNARRPAVQGPLGRARRQRDRRDRQHAARRHQAADVPGAGHEAGRVDGRRPRRDASAWPTGPARPARGSTTCGGSPATARPSASGSPSMSTLQRPISPASSTALRPTATARPTSSKPSSANRTTRSRRRSVTGSSKRRQPRRRRWRRWRRWSEVGGQRSEAEVRAQRSASSSSDRRVGADRRAVGVSL